MIDFKTSSMKARVEGFKLFSKETPGKYHLCLKGATAEMWHVLTNPVQYSCNHLGKFMSTCILPLSGRGTFTVYHVHTMTVGSSADKHYRDAHARHPHTRSWQHPPGCLRLIPSVSCSPRCSPTDITLYGCRLAAHLPI